MKTPMVMIQVKHSSGRYCAEAIDTKTGKRIKATATASPAHAASSLALKFFPYGFVLTYLKHEGNTGTWRAAEGDK